MFSLRSSLSIIFPLVLVFNLLNCQSEHFRGSEMPADITTTDFALTDQNGQPFTLSKQKGKVVLVFFGYTFCPDVCPMTLSNWTQIQNELADLSSEVKFVYITVDPERDTPQRLKDHLAVYSTQFIGLTGTQESLDSVYTAYGVYHDKNEATDGGGAYFMSHTSSTYVFDRQGKWRLVLPYGTDIKDVVHDIKLLLE